VAPTLQQMLPIGSAAAEWASAGAGADSAAAEAAAAAANAADGMRSRFSLDFYPEHSSMYVVGEVCAPTDSDGTKGLSQKLLQAERVLQFLCAEEGRGLEQCVLGMVFLGPSMGPVQSLALFLTLQHYQPILPCLWCLHGLKRLLCCRVRVFEPSVEVMQLADAMECLGMGMLQLREQQQRLQEQLQLQYEQQQLQHEQIMLAIEEIRLGMQMLTTRQGLQPVEKHPRNEENVIKCTLCLLM
jgi:hypothetical protein